LSFLKRFTFESPKNSIYWPHVFVFITQFSHLFMDDLHELEDQVRHDAQGAFALFSSLTGLKQPVPQSLMPAPAEDPIAEPMQRLQQLEEQIRFLARVTDALLAASAELGLYDDQVLWIPTPQLNAEMHRVAQLARPAHDESTAEAGRVI
jgi:hypothetical protein